MNIYEVIESKSWVHPEKNYKVSIYGCPPVGDGWEVKVCGYTVYNIERGTVGIGRIPWVNREDAQKWVDGEHARLNSFRSGSASQ